MLRFSVTAEAEERLESLRERMADRGMALDIEEVLELAVKEGIEKLENTLNILTACESGLLDNILSGKE